MRNEAPRSDTAKRARKAVSKWVRREDVRESEGRMCGERVGAAAAVDEGFPGCEVVMSSGGARGRHWDRGG